ncbi:MAG TPA: hypothetical protein VGI23_24740 [Steroidobacteraceae bacterium]|jgi:hypothetical protein
MNDADWVNVDSFADRFSAEALVGLLASEGVPAYIAADEPIPGLSRNFSVLVPPDLAHRAQWILKQTVSEDELTLLAVGMPDPTGEKSS